MRVARSLFVVVLVAYQLTCGIEGSGDDTRDGPSRPRELPFTSKSVEEKDLPAPDDQDRLQKAHHLLWVSGDLSGAKQLLARVAESRTAPMDVRARAELQMAELAEIVGDRRSALNHLERAKIVAGPGHSLALEADDRRARILVVAPLAEVRGPVPGSVILRNEQAPVVANFRRAERLLAAYHRVIVAPRLEDMNEVLQRKKRALAVAVAAYQRVSKQGGNAARAAALFRIGAMYHHLAEALVFAIPSELLPSVARHFRRQYKVESTAHLRKSLEYYQEASRVPSSPGTEPWRELARRESNTLEIVLHPSPRKRAK